jgi:hypothetical protein
MAAIASRRLPDSRTRQASTASATDGVSLVGGSADDRRVVGNGLEDHRAHPDHGSRADRHVIPDEPAESHECGLADPCPTADDRARCQMGEVADDDVMLDDGPGVDDDVGAHLRPGVDHGAGEDDSPGTE